MRGWTGVVVILIVLGGQGGARANQLDTATAILDAQVGPASLRGGSKGKETQLKSEKDLGRILRPGEQLRCGKNCRLEVLLCTGNRVILETKDGWYRIPSLDCEKEQWTPGFRNYLIPGGRRAQNAKPETQESERRRVLKQALLNSILSDIIRGAKGAAVGAAIGSGRFTADPLENRTCPKNYEWWVFEYPREGDLVVPSLLTFDIRRRYSFNAPNLSMVFEFTVFDDESDSDPLRIREEANIINGLIAKTQIHPTRNLKEFLLQSVRRSRIRIFWTVTASILEKSGRRLPTAHTFGSEFFVVSSEEEMEITRELREPDQSTGVTRFLAKAEIFERLGLWDRAIDEYSQALSLSPQNEFINPRLQKLSRADCTPSFHR